MSIFLCYAMHKKQQNDEESRVRISREAQSMRLMRSIPPSEFD